MSGDVRVRVPRGGRAHGDLILADGRRYPYRAELDVDREVILFVWLGDEVFHRDRHDAIEQLARRVWIIAKVLYCKGGPQTMSIGYMEIRDAGTIGVTEPGYSPHSATRWD